MTQLVRDPIEIKYEPKQELKQKQALAFENISSIDSSFTLLAMKILFSSDYLYPSNNTTRPIQDEGSLKDTFADPTTFSAIKTPSNTTYAGKVTRAVARYAISTFITLTVSPVGMVYHGVFSIGYLTKYSVNLIKGNEDINNHDWKKVKNHFCALYTDGSITIIAVYVNVLGVSVDGWLAKKLINEKVATCFSLTSACVKHIPKCLLNRNYSEFLATIVHIAAYNFANLIPFLSAIFPCNVLPAFLAFSSERAGLYKSLMLKNVYGYVGEDNKILTWDYTKDKEYFDIKRGLFGGFYLSDCQDFLFAVGDLQKNLRDAGQRPLSFNRIFGNRDFNPTIFIKYLKDNRAQFRDINIDQQIQKFEQIQKLIEETKHHVQRSLELQEVNITLMVLAAAAGVEVKLPEIIMPLFGFPTPTCMRYFTGQVHQAPAREENWRTKYIKSLTNNVEGLDHAQLALFNEFRIKIRSRENISSQGFFNLENDFSQRDLRRAYRKCAIVFHPDKVPQGYTLEATQIFACISEAYTDCERILEERR